VPEAFRDSEAGLGVGQEYSAGSAEFKLKFRLLNCRPTTADRARASGCRASSGEEKRIPAWSRRADSPDAAVITLSEMASVYAKYAYLISTAFVTLALLVPGTFFLLDGLGVSPMPDPLRRSHVNGADKFEGAAAMLGLSPTTVILLLGSCKVSAVFAIWSDSMFGLEQLATLLAAIMYICVAIGHYRIDGDFIGPVIFASVTLVKLLNRPSKKAVSKPSRGKET
jgi:hypothetical protein